MQLDWAKSTEQRWYRLDEIDLQHPSFDHLEGVYIIWHGGSRAATVRVGQGHIRDALTAQRRDEPLNRFFRLGLFVTWAAVERSARDGVEAYLTHALEPKVTKHMARQSPIPVNLPW